MLCYITSMNDLLTNVRTVLVSDPVISISTVTLYCPAKIRLSRPSNLLYFLLYGLILLISTMLVNPNAID